MNRLLNLLEYALRALLRRWQKQLALVLIYAVVVGFFSSVVFFTTALKEEALQTLSEVPELWIQKLAGGRLIPIDTGFVAQLQGIRGVSEVLPRTWGYVYDGPTGAVFTVLGAHTSWAGLPLQLSQNFTSDSLAVGQALCGTGFLEARGLMLGDKLTLQDSNGSMKAYRIVATFNSSSDLLTRDLIVLHPADARQVLGIQKAFYTDVALRVNNSDEVENIARKLDRQLGGVRIVTLSQLKSTYEALFGWRGGIFVYGAMVSVLAFLILAWDRAAGLSGEEKKEIAILKGIGWSISDVLLMKMAEGLIISFTATLLGLLLAYWHVFVLQAPLLKPFLIGWSVMYPSYQLAPIMQLEDLLVIICMAVIPYLSALLIPSWYGAIAEPADAMRGV